MLSTVVLKLLSYCVPVCVWCIVASVFAKVCAVSDEFVVSVLSGLRMWGVVVFFVFLFPDSLLNSFQNCGVLRCEFSWDVSASHCSVLYVCMSCLISLLGC